MRRACSVVAMVAVACAFPIADAELGWPRLPLVMPRAIQLAVGSDHACARMADLTLRCWGEIEHEPGTNTRGVRYTAVEQPVTGVLDVEVTGSRTCARLSTGTRQCWGGERAGPPAKCRIDDHA
ncbi:MAG TPA: RCC1 domain-containing protein, partial [Kofleriaceae bacterium]|nr:RCC1 domain-containing protein [Kofleriaceae bacterium]